MAKMRRASRVAALGLLLVSFLAFVYYVLIEELLRQWFVRGLQRSAGLGALRNAPVSLGALAVRGWSLELRHLRIGNVHGGGYSWSAPFVLHIDYLRVNVGGPIRLLSLVQLPAAEAIDAPAGIVRVGPLDLIVGFRVKAIEEIDIEGLQLYLEDARPEDADGGPLAAVSEAVLMRGRLHKDPINGRLGVRRHREFVLERSTLSWFEILEGDSPRGASAAAGQAPKPKGSLRLFASSSVQALASPAGVAADDPRLELISGRDYLTLHAATADDRDAWVSALAGAIAELARAGEGGGRAGLSTNAPWMDALEAANEARKLRWRRRELRRRREWRRRWNPDDNAEDEDDGEATGDDAAGEDAVGEQGAEGDEGNEAAGDEAAEAKDAISESGASALAHVLAGLRGLPQLVAARGALLAPREPPGAARAKEDRFESALEWRIGRLAIRTLVVHVNGQRLELADGGWALRGFVGSDDELRRELQFGLAARVLRDSGERALREGVSGFTGRDEYQFGDLTKAALSKVGAGVAAGVSSITGKETYEFGDLTKAAVDKVGAGVASSVSDFTGKEKYEFGDVTRAAIGKLARHFKKHRPGGSLGASGGSTGECDAKETCAPSPPGGTGS